MLKSADTYLYLGATVVVIGLILVLTHKKKSVAVIPGETTTVNPKAPASTTGAAPVIITNFDSVWDYKLENGIWYTKKKTSSTWNKMENVASDYKTAVAKLTAFLKK